MKKIVCVLGSPRLDGNSAAIAKRILNTAESLGARSEIFELNKMNVKGCQACMACKKTLDTCIVKDDLAALLDSIHAADAVIIASPIYFGQVTGQLKCFIDRAYSFLNPDYMTNTDCSRLAPGKKCIFVLTQGQPKEEMFEEVYPGLERFFKWFGFENHLIRGLGLRDRKEAEANAALMIQADDISRLIMAKD